MFGSAFFPQLRQRWLRQGLQSPAVPPVFRLLLPVASLFSRRHVPVPNTLCLSDPVRLVLMVLPRCTVISLRQFPESLESLWPSSAKTTVLPLKAVHTCKDIRREINHQSTSQFQNDVWNGSIPSFLATCVPYLITSGFQAFSRSLFHCEQSAKTHVPIRIRNPELVHVEPAKLTAAVSTASRID